MDHPQFQQRPQEGRIDSMLEKAEKILWPVIVAILGTEQGRALLMAEAAVQHLIVFVLSLGGFILVALVRRFDTGCRLILIDACSVFVRVMMFVSLACIFVHNKLPLIIYSPLFVFLLLPLLLGGQRAGGGGEDGRSSAVRRERSNAMLKKAEQILLPVVAVFLATEEGRKLLMSEAAAKHLIVFVLSIACFCILALICRIDFTGFVVAPDYIDDCSALFKAMIFMSLVGIFMHDELPWITYTPLLLVLLLIILAVMRSICKLNNGENIIVPEMNE